MTSSKLASSLSREEKDQSYVLLTRAPTAAVDLPTLLYVSVTFPYNNIGGPNPFLFLLSVAAPRIHIH